MYIRISPSVQLSGGRPMVPRRRSSRPCFPVRCRSSDRNDLTKPSTRLEGIGVLPASRRQGPDARGRRTSSANGTARVGHGRERSDSMVVIRPRSGRNARNSHPNIPKAYRRGAPRPAPWAKADPDSGYSLRPASPRGGGLSEVAKGAAALAFVVDECCGIPGYNEFNIILE